MDGMCVNSKSLAKGKLFFWHEHIKYYTHHDKDNRRHNHSTIIKLPSEASAAKFIGGLKRFS